MQHKAGWMTLLLMASAVCAAAIDASEQQATVEDQQSSGAETQRQHALPLSGELRAHDPALARNGKRGDWFVFSTGDPLVAGGTVQIRRSTDLRNWTYAGNVFETIPAWILQANPAVTNLWAPEVIEHAGTYFLYYSASTFGSNRSMIGLATN